MTPFSDDEFLADQYLLGLLDLNEQSATELHIAQDGAFAHLGVAASRRFAHLDDYAEPIALPGGAWTRLQAWPDMPVKESLSVSPLAGARESAVNPNRAPWRVALGLAAALLLALGLSWPFLQAPSSVAIAVTVLLDPNGAPFALIEDFGGGEAEVIALVTYEVPAGKSLQAWTKWSEETGPVSLGVLDAFTSAPLGADGLPNPIVGQLYEITLEEGGSATGRPTGPILGVGRAAVPG